MYGIYEQSHRTGRHLFHDRSQVVFSDPVDLYSGKTDPIPAPGGARATPSEIWAIFRLPGRHDRDVPPDDDWENLIGRSRGCDVILNLNSVSRSHGTLIRDSDGVWKYNDLNSKNGSAINGVPVKEPTILKAGDVLTIGGSDFTLYPVSLEERMANIEKRKKRTHPVSPWPSLVALTLFQFLMCVQFKVALGEDFPPQLPFAVGLLCILMWTYVIIMRFFKRVGFEMEIIAFYLSTLSLAVTASAYPSTVLKQSICICLGVGLFFGLCWFLRDLNWAKRIVYIMMGISVLLLIINLAFGTTKYGASNWVSIGGMSIQPSELVKIVFIYVGAATLDELQQRKNLLIFMGFSVFCLGCLALMGDFGTALIFFVTFLVISFLRSGDFSKIILILGASGLMGMMVLRFKPYISRRFDTWGHVPGLYPTGGGFQQVQTMTASASGGLPGLGAGNWEFSQVAASPTDLVFGLLSEEWGLVRLWRSWQFCASSLLERSLCDPLLQDVPLTIVSLLVPLHPCLSSRRYSMCSALSICFLSYWSHIPVRLVRGYEYAGLLGTAVVSEGRRYKAKRQLRYTAGQKRRIRQRTGRRRAGKSGRHFRCSRWEPGRLSGKSQL